MYDIQSYLTAMSSGLLTNKRVNQAKYGIVKKKNKRINKVSSHANFHGIDWNISEDDLP